MYAPGDAELDVVAGVLAGGKNSRLYKRLVYDLQIAQNVSAYQASNGLGSMFLIEVMARPSQDPPAQAAREDQADRRRGTRRRCGTRRPPTAKSSAC